MATLRETTQRTIIKSVPGFFVHHGTGIPDPTVLGSSALRFGLIERTYDTDQEFDPNLDKTQWERFENYVNNLNIHTPSSTSFKVLFLGRHGEGFHNVAESKYGTPAWDSYWSRLEGDGDMTWADAHLTEKGISQAKAANQLWLEGLTNAHIPHPQLYYTSPLARCLETARLTFAGISEQPFQVKELLREVIGIHTCDRRSRCSWIQEHYPTFNIEQGFSEEDPLWTADARETAEEQLHRIKSLLKSVLINEEKTFISMTSHSGAIKTLLTAIDHPSYELKTGGIVPVLVRVDRVDCVQ